MFDIREDETQYWIIEYLKKNESGFDYSLYDIRYVKNLYEFVLESSTHFLTINYEGKRVVPYKLTIETHINRVMIWCNNDQYLNGSYIDNLGLEKFIRKAKIERLLCH